MLPATFQALGVILLAIVPGFVATTFWARTRTWKGRSTDLITVLQSMAVSLMIVTVMAFPAVRWLFPVRDHLDDHPLRVAILFFVTALLVPVVSGIVVAKVGDWLSQPTSMRIRGGIRGVWARIWPSDVPPTIWDWAFKSGIFENAFVIIEFSDKSRVAGIYAEGSVALTSPEPPGVYLSREWTLDESGDLLEEVPGTNGVIITNAANIRTIRIIRGESRDG